MIESHVVKARGRVITRCDVNENTCGNRALMFIERIVVNRARRIAVSLFFVLFRVNDASFSRKLMRGVAVFQIGIEIRLNIMSQQSLIWEAVGSKIENRLFITLRVYALGVWKFCLIGLVFVRV